MPVSKPKYQEINSLCRMGLKCFSANLANVFLYHVKVCVCLIRSLLQLVTIGHCTEPLRKLQHYLR